MLFDLSMTELMLIGAVALVVIGPKDLPKALRVAGYWVRKARTLSREFHSSVEQMIREAELDEMRQELKKATEIDLDKEFRQTIDPTGSLAESLKPPELPRFSNADLPAARAAAPQTAAPVMPEAIEGGMGVSAPPPVMSPDSAAVPTQGASPAPATTVAPTDPPDGSQELVSGESSGPAARGGAEGNTQSPAIPGFPLSRE
jgi:sec-independent protein translocase protein TatB